MLPAGVKDEDGVNEEMAKTIKDHRQKNKNSPRVDSYKYVFHFRDQWQDKGIINCPCESLQVIGLNGDLNLSIINFKTRRSPIPSVVENLCVSTVQYKSLGVPQGKSGLFVTNINFLSPVRPARRFVIKMTTITWLPYS